MYLKQESAVKAVNCFNPDSVKNVEFSPLFTELNCLGQTAHGVKGIALHKK